LNFCNDIFTDVDYNILQHNNDITTEVYGPLSCLRDFVNIVMSLLVW